MSIEQQLDLKFPIYLNNWTIEEAFVNYLINKIVTRRPVNVVELGSGTSSLIILKTLKKLGYKYTLTSFDSDKLFLDGTKNLLIAEEVFNEQLVKLVFSPINDVEINGSLYKWYNPKDFKFDFDKIDLLFIDGPFGGFCKNARYPAVSVMKKYLKEGSVVILHDSKRTDEMEIVEMWKRENADIKVVYQVETERGGAEVRF